MEKWKSKTAIVTGASAGIGDAIARDLAKHGINIVALARRMERLEYLKDQLKDEPGKVIPIECDLLDKASIDIAFEKIEKEVGSVQILVNSAGICTKNELFDDKEEIEDIIAETINTNFLGLVRISRKAYKLMKKSGDYRIFINIGSYVGHNASFDFPVNVYPATNYAVRAVTESMRQELIKVKDLKTRVCEISPGSVQGTEIGAGTIYTPDDKAMIASGEIPMLKTSDVSQAVLFMLMTPYEVNITEMIVKPVGERN